MNIIDIYLIYDTPICENELISQITNQSVNFWTLNNFTI